MVIRIAPQYSGVYQIAVDNNHFIQYPYGVSDIIYIGGTLDRGMIKNQLLEHFQQSQNNQMFHYYQNYHLFFQFAYSNTSWATRFSLLDTFQKQFGSYPVCQNS